MQISIFRVKKITYSLLSNLLVIAFVGNLFLYISNVSCQCLNNGKSYFSNDLHKRWTSTNWISCFLHHKSFLKLNVKTYFKNVRFILMNYEMYSIYIVEHIGTWWLVRYYKLGYVSKHPWYIASIWFWYIWAVTRYQSFHFNSNDVINQSSFPF